MLQRLSDQRHLTLLVFILLLFVLGPVATSLRYGVLIFNLIGAGVLMAATYALSRKGRSIFISATILSAISIALTCWVLYGGSHLAAILSHCSIIVLVGLFVVTILGDVLREEKITADKIHAAICVYLLIGYGWSFAYSVLDELEPDAFAIPTPVESGDYAAQVTQFRYFSFVTLTTMGYGDIVPRSNAARTMVILEAVVGQLYLVALVGRLVGLHIVHCSPLSRSDEP